MDISIIIPIYNVEDYLEECLHSVQNNIQQLDAEILLIDDGSTDNSSKIAQSFAQKDKNYRYFRKDNGGSSSARNYGVDLAQGDYLFFMDSDDILPEGILGKMLAAAKHNRTDVTTCDVAKYQDGKMVSSAIHLRAFYNLKGTVSTVEEHPNLIFDCNAANKLIRREFYVSHGFYFPEGRLYEDIPVLIPVYCEANAISVIRQIGYIWRIRPQGERSNTQSYHDRKSIQDKIEMIASVFRYLSETGASPKVKKALENKVLTVDFTGFINRLEEMETQDANEYVEWMAQFVEEYISEEALADLPIVYRQTFAYILDRNLDALMRLVRYKLSNYSRAPISRTEQGLRVKLRDDLFTVTERGIEKEFVNDPPRCMVDRCSLDKNSVKLTGHVYTRRLDIKTPEEQKISAYLLHEVTGEICELDARSCESHFLTVEQGTILNYDDYNNYHYNHDGAGFLINIDFAKIEAIVREPGDCVVFIRFGNEVYEGERILRGMKSAVKKQLAAFRFEKGDNVSTFCLDQRDTLIIRTKSLRQEKKEKTEQRRDKINRHIQRVTRRKAK